HTDAILLQFDLSLSRAATATYTLSLHDALPISWLDGADVVVGRAVLHHVPMAEFLLGRLRAALRPGTRVGFIEPDFRTPLARLADRKSTRLNSSHLGISYAVFCLKKKTLLFPLV